MTDIQYNIMGDLVHYAPKYHRITNYFESIETMTEESDKNEYHMIIKIDNTVKMQIDVEEYTLHAHHMIITKEDILHIGERLGYNIQNDVTYNILSSIKGMSSIIFLQNKNIIELINLSSILDGQIDENLITKMQGKYATRHMFSTKILKPILEYGTVDVTKKLGMFTFRPIYESIHDYHHCWKWVRHNINKCSEHGMYRKTIMGKDYQKRLIFCLITESVDNIDEFRKLYERDCCHNDTSPLYPYCKVKYVNHNKKFSKSIRCPTIREWNNGLIYPF